jgi:TP53 regulating kinase-like protein
MGQSGQDEKLSALMRSIGSLVGVIHAAGLVHGDLTTSNIMVANNSDLYLIDFGLGQAEASAEDRGVDLYVLERALISAHPGAEHLFRVSVNRHLH